MNNSINIKSATKKDIPLILSLIKELAKYEKNLDKVTATEHTLCKNLFGSHQYAEVIIASINSDVAGHALFFHNFSTFSGKAGLYLEDMYVRAEFRGQGIAKHMFGYLAKLALERDCSMLELACLKWNKLAIDFYTNIGALPLSERELYRVTEDKLVALANNYQAN